MNMLVVLSLPLLISSKNFLIETKDSVEASGDGDDVVEDTLGEDYKMNMGSFHNK